MSAHINANGEFQSDKYPTCPPGKVPLSVKDPTAQDLLWEYAQRRRAVDAEFSDDLEQSLLRAGFDRPKAPRDGITLPGWSCRECYVFNGEEKERREDCRSCGAKR